MGEEAEPIVSLVGSCGTEHFSNVQGRPSSIMGSDWVCDDPFVLINAEIVPITAGNNVIKCEY